MLKLTAVVSLMLIGSSVWTAGISCDSCGSECASACGTRHFRSCCFNYLRKKREPEIDAKIWPLANREVKGTRAASLNPHNPLVIVENVASVPESWLSNLVEAYNQPHMATLPHRSIEDLENRVQYLYD